MNNEFQTVFVIDRKSHEMFLSEARLYFRPNPSTNTCTLSELKQAGFHLVLEEATVTAVSYH